VLDSAGESAVSALRAAFERLAPLDDPDWARLEPHVATATLARGAHFAEAGRAAPLGALIVSGLVRAYYNTPDGLERVTDFCAEGSFLASYAAVLSGEPAEAAMQALEPTTLVTFPIVAFRELVATSTAWGRIGRLIVEMRYVLQSQRICELLTLDAAARLERFERAYAALLPRLNQQHVASFVGVSRESVSRLKHRR
jgi:CRP-like cAMP-binding protein